MRKEISKELPQVRFGMSVAQVRSRLDAQRISSNISTAGFAKSSYCEPACALETRGASYIFIGNRLVRVDNN